MELQEQLKNEAINLGACDDGISSWGNPDVNELCRKYFKYQDFCIEHDFPSLEEFNAAGKDSVESNGIFFDGNGNCCNMPHVAVIGNANVDVHVIKPCNITVRHKGRVNVYVENNVLCYISMHDACKVNIVSKHPNGRVCVSYWSGEIENKEMIDKIYTKS